MTEKDKAIQLVSLFMRCMHKDDPYREEYAKKAANICVDELLKEFGKRFAPASHTACVYADNHAFYNKVKEEIEKL